jgi:hypothetical protein
MSGPITAPARATEASPDRLVILEVDELHAAASYRNMFIICWTGDTKPGAAARLIQPMSRLGEQFPDGIGLMQVVGATTGPPSSEARGALSKLLQAGSEIILCSTLVVPGVGFRMAAARAFATGLIMLARLRFPHEVYARVAEAATWQVTLLPPGKRPAMKAHDLIAAVTELQKKQTDLALRPRMRP